MSDNGHERWAEEAAAYMLGALEPEEATEFERHLEGCERCRSEVRWLTAAVEVLPEAVERHEPPPLHSAGRRLAGLGSGPRDWRRLAWLSAMLLLVVAIGAYEIGSGGGSDGGGSTEAFISGHAPGVTAEVVREGHEGEIHLAAVGTLPPNRVLEAWVRRDGEVEPVKALFVPDGEGNASTTLGDLKGVDVVMVTTEPAGGSESPTGQPIAEVPIS
jgi:anti-sigma-K factor RskA